MCTERRRSASQPRRLVMFLAIVGIAIAGVLVVYNQPSAAVRSAGASRPSQSRIAARRGTDAP